MAIKLFRDAYTGPDGKYYAIGRLYSAPVMALGLAYPTYEVLGRGKEYSLVEMGSYLGLLGGAVWVFIRGHNNIDQQPQGTPANA